MGKYIIDNASKCFTKVFRKQSIEKKINGILMNWYMNKNELSRRLLLARFIMIFDDFQIRI